jgi:competence protein ComGC
MQRAVGQRGFTIIEVMFFLAISSALLVALLATVGFTISRQRFTDSGTGLQAFFQTDYNEALNVVNDRSPGVCALAGGGSNTAVGSTSCVVLGKAIDVTQGSSDMVAYNVIGTEPANPGNATGKDLLALYNPTIDTSASTPYSVPWGATVYGTRINGAHVDGAIRILILRSPDSGLPLTFGQAGNGASLTPALTAGAQAYAVCIQSADLLSSVTAISLSGIAGSEGVTAQFDLSGTDKGNLC